MDKSLIQVAEDALSYVFQAGFEESNESLKNASSYFTKTVLAQKAQRGILDNMLERRIEKWTKYSTFISAITRRTLTSSRFVRPVAKFIHVKIEKESNKIDSFGRKGQL